MKAKDYFEENAAAYDAKRERGFLGWLRKNEKSAVLSFLDIKKGESMLDAGCGEGYYAQLAKSKGAKVFGIDVSKEMIAKLQAKGIQGKACDLENCSLGKKFDKIVCAGVLEFTANPRNVVGMLAKHLKSKGRIVILYSRPSPGTIVYVSIHRLHGLRLKIISRKKLQNLLKRAGLTITRHRKLPLFGGVALVEHESQ
ncbi:MAG TPA: class I SAM-dependent methyltransferase [Candidatus Nanoarchaeia archaeon]|nr:class I SAM-dependent methyltransferase [Candidatus Nanoarchaeia archaeon]